jgi:HK97 gp10 family phage protein
MSDRRSHNLQKVRRSGGGYDISLLGFGHLLDSFSKLDTAIQGKILRVALRAGGNWVLKESKRLCPIRSGKLKRSLKLRAMKRRRGRVGYRIMTGTREELGISEDDKGYYPAMVELGTRKMPAKSYLRAAVKNTEDVVFSIINDRISKGVQKAWDDVVGSVPF